MYDVYILVHVMLIT